VTFLRICPARLILCVAIATPLADARSACAQPDQPAQSAPNQVDQADQAPATGAPSTAQSSDPGFWLRWEDRSQQAQVDQPNWLTPVITSTARLKQEIRYDIYWQRNPNGGTQENYGNSKGLALIPFSRVEISIDAPPVFVHHESKVKDGVGDFSVIAKFRILAANREKGDYILTTFLNVSFPTGTYKNGSPHAVLTPTIAGGKGLGNFVYQGTFGVDLPSADTALLGRRLALNNALQYRRIKTIWPELEVNSNFYEDGSNAGKKQVLLTPGIVAGRFRVYRNLSLTIGGGVGFAVTHFHSNTHEQVLTVRLPF
jgi:hypothetical protein